MIQVGKLILRDREGILLRTTWELNRFLLQSIANPGRCLPDVISFLEPFSVIAKYHQRFHFIYFFKLKLLSFFLYFWLCWVFVSVRGLSLVAASRGHSSSRCAGLSLSRPLSLRSTGSRCAGSVAVAHGPSCSAARGIFPDQGSNPCPLHWQADSQPLHHQGSPEVSLLFFMMNSRKELFRGWG